jgi:hypothetical protein
LSDAFAGGPQYSFHGFKSFGALETRRPGLPSWSKLPSFLAEGNARDLHEGSAASRDDFYVNCVRPAILRRAKISDSAQTCIARAANPIPFDRLVCQMGETVKHIRNGLVGSSARQAVFQRGSSTFLHKRTNGRWRDVFSSAEVQLTKRWQARIRLLSAHWVATGKIGCGCSRKYQTLSSWRHAECSRRPGAHDRKKCVSACSVSFFLIGSRRKQLPVVGEIVRFLLYL